MSDDLAGSQEEVIENLLFSGTHSVDPLVINGAAVAD
jgi:hypothetical protein